MGMPALRHDSHVVHAPRPRLRVVKPGTRVAAPHSPAKKQAPSRAHAAARDAFRFFGIVVAAVALLGLGRIWLSVQAAQASIDSTTLRREIKQERYVGDMLEIQQSALATPSRIQAIAGTTMGMAPARKISYLDMRGTETARETTAPAELAASGSSSGLLAKAMDVAAGEAQVLLVGDVGLVSSQ